MVDDLGPLAVKGRVEPVRVYGVRGTVKSASSK
jgi:hypothetical protein